MKKWGLIGAGVLILLALASVAACESSDYAKKEAATDTAISRYLSEGVPPYTPVPTYIPVLRIAVYGNPDTMIYHHPPDHLNAKQPCRALSPAKAIRFNSSQEARAAGYRPCETRGCDLP